MPASFSPSINRGSEQLEAESKTLYRKQFKNSDTQTLLRIHYTEWETFSLPLGLPRSNLLSTSNRTARTAPGHIPPVTFVAGWTIYVRSLWRQPRVMTHESRAVSMGVRANGLFCGWTIRRELSPTCWLISAGRLTNVRYRSNLASNHAQDAV